MYGVRFRTGNYCTGNPQGRGRTVGLATILLISLHLAPVLVKAAENPQATCHDEIWEPTEFCGRDAWVQTGEPELNHDCVVDYFDRVLIERQFGMTGPGLSADFDADEDVDADDLVIFSNGFGSTVDPCAAYPDVDSDCSGTLSLSFSSDPQSIQPQITVESFETFDLHVVANGFGSAEVIEVNYDFDPAYAASGVSSGGDVLLDEPGHFIVEKAGGWGSGPVVVATVQHTALLETPAAEFRLNSFEAPAKNRHALSLFEGGVSFAILGNAVVNQPGPVADAAAPCCHDDTWGADEFCGRDALQNTGSPDMNHDCLVDWFDMAILRQQFGESGPGYGADLNDDQIVDAGDLLVLANALNTNVAPCEVFTRAPDDCRGMLSLSFDSDPNNIVPTIAVASPTTLNLYVVADLWEDADGLEFSLSGASHNVVVQSIRSTANVLWDDNLPSSNGPNVFLLEHATQWNPGPVVVAEFEIELLDTQPVQLTLAAASPAQNRYSTTSFGNSVRFKYLNGAAVNTTAPPPTRSDCRTSDSPGPPRRVLQLTAHPNPFNPRTNLTYRLEESGRVQLSIYDLAGRRQALLVAPGWKPAGEYSVAWDGRNEEGVALASGLYFCLLESQAHRVSEKLVLLK